MANYANLISGVLASGVTSSDTTMTVTTSNDSSSSDILPAVPFYLTIMPDAPSLGVPNANDSEIVLVTAKSGAATATLTVTRAQKGTAAKAFDSGAIVTIGVYAEDSVFLGTDGTTEAETPWLSASALIWSTMVNKIYPVGSIYLSATLSTAAQVGAVLGGTWETWGEGRVPVGVDSNQTEFDAVEETGGEKTHTLTASESPRFTGELRMAALWTSNMLVEHSSGIVSASQSGATIHGSWSTSSTSSGQNDTANFSFGGGESHNNLQPYITCYMYKRIA